MTPRARFFLTPSHIFFIVFPVTCVETGEPKAAYIYQYLGREAYLSQRWRWFAFLKVKLYFEEESDLCRDETK